jgi:hypothetical protein
MASSRISKTDNDYDARLKQIQERNHSILGHFVHTWKGRVSDDTLYQHVLNIQHFSGWHLNYGRADDELHSVDQITAWDVYDFITDWLPRKSWVDSERRIKSYLATLKKYVEFMAKHGYMPADVATDALRTIKEEREDMICAAVTYYNDPEEDQSPEAFRAQLHDLEARWAALTRKGKATGNKSAASRKKRKSSTSAREKT